METRTGQENHHWRLVYGKKKALDFTHIDDAISGTISAIEKFDKVKNEVFNIASGESTELIHIAKKIKEFLSGRNRLLSKIIGKEKF